MSSVSQILWKSMLDLMLLIVSLVVKLVASLTTFSSDETLLTAILEIWL